MPQEHRLIGYGHMCQQAGPDAYMSAWVDGQTGDAIVIQLNEEGLRSLISELQGLLSKIALPNNADIQAVKR